MHGGELGRAAAAQCDLIDKYAPERVTLSNGRTPKVTYEVGSPPFISMRIAELSDILFHKVADLSSPILMQMCAMGKTVPKAKFEFMRADGNGVPIKYFEIELENVLIGQISPAVSGGSLMSEGVGLKYSKIKWKYSQQKVGGGAGGNTAGGWDLATNKVA